MKIRFKLSMKGISPSECEGAAVDLACQLTAIVRRPCSLVAMTQRPCSLVGLTHDRALVARASVVALSAATRPQATTVCMHVTTSTAVGGRVQGGLGRARRRLQLIQPGSCAVKTRMQQAQQLHAGGSHVGSCELSVHCCRLQALLSYTAAAAVQYRPTQRCNVQQTWASWVWYNHCLLSASVHTQC